MGPQCGNLTSALLNNSLLMNIFR